jgi:uncharacterized membrane protein YobD (UPF0266 family)
MDAFLFLMSDRIWIVLLEFVIIFILFWAIYHDVLLKFKLSGAEMQAVLKRGEQSWSTLLSFWALAIILIEIIISSEAIAKHRVVIGLLNVAAFVYLNLFSFYFKNKVIGWAMKLKNIKERVA